MAVVLTPNRNRRKKLKTYRRGRLDWRSPEEWEQSPENGERSDLQQLRRVSGSQQHTGALSVLHLEKEAKTTGLTVRKRIAAEGGRLFAGRRNTRRNCRREAFPAGATREVQTRQMACRKCWDASETGRRTGSKGTAI